MAQNITLLGASYSNVPAIQLPKTGGGTVRFDDASVTTATASDVANGKVFLASDGTITTGTGSGGGGYNFSELSSPSPSQLYVSYPTNKQLLYSWDLTNSLTDTVQGATITLKNATQDSNGITLTSSSSYATMPFYYRPYCIYEFDISSMSKDFASGHGRFILMGANDSGFIARSGSQWGAYLNGSWATNQGTYTSLAGKTLTLVTENDKPKIYLDGELWYSISRTQNLALTNRMTIGSSGGQSFFSVTISGIRVYWGVYINQLS